MGEYLQLAIINKFCEKVFERSVDRYKAIEIINKLKSLLDKLEESWPASFDEATRLDIEDERARETDEEQEANENKLSESTDKQKEIAYELSDLDESDEQY